jgi:hypothetical protein
MLPSLQREYFSSTEESDNEDTGTAWKKKREKLAKQRTSEMSCQRGNIAVKLYTETSSTMKGWDFLNYLSVLLAYEVLVSVYLISRLSFFSSG